MGSGNTHIRVVLVTKRGRENTELQSVASSVVSCLQIKRDMIERKKAAYPEDLQTAFKS